MRRWEFGLPAQAMRSEFRDHGTALNDNPAHEDSDAGKSPAANAYLNRRYEAPLAVQIRLEKRSRVSGLHGSPVTQVNARREQ